MRLDLFLKMSHLCPRRAVAQKLCEAGLVSVNGKPVKPAHAVKPGDLITLQSRERIQTLRIRALPAGHQLSKKDTSSLYDKLSEELREARD
jgi:ribosome-associated heat shock protein Hsp15